MAFGLERDIFKRQLEKLGANVVSNEETHRLIVNDKYEISYTNFWYRYKGADTTIAQGKQQFLKLIEEEMNNR
ncbi:MAG: hypothetical protein IJA32_01885 [Lachnospiraceae bacterium]|nr:hypothetical protein [Lachnospiraceae bacterium]